ncbi:MAG: hypothetical protein WBC51_17400 [Vicinamibacterales bacterium]
MRRRPPRHEPGELHPPAAIVITDEPANPITGESSREQWKRWSQERTEKDRREHIREVAAAKAHTEQGIYAVEIAREIAAMYASGIAPEWRYLRDVCRERFAKILRQQPELRYAEKRERLFNAVVAELPAHMRGVMGELRTLLELVSIARESTAFLIAFEIGREAGRRDALRDPRVMLAPSPQRRALPPHPEEPRTLRLHIHDEDAFDEKGWRIK